MRTQESYLDSRAGKRGKSEVYTAREGSGQSKQCRANSVEYDESTWNSRMEGATCREQHGGEQPSGKFGDTQTKV